MIIAALAVVVVGLTSRWLWRSIRRQAHIRRHRRESARACHHIASHVGIGMLPIEAIEASLATNPCLEPVVRTYDVGGDAIESLMRLGHQPGYDGLGHVARAWRLCQLSGASLNEAVTAVVDGIRADQRLREHIDAELSSSRATGRILAGLPLVGLVMGWMVGADPLAFLLGTPVGRLCCLGAIVATACGIIWLEKIADVEASDSQESRDFAPTLTLLASGVDSGLPVRSAVRQVAHLSQPSTQKLLESVLARFDVGCDDQQAWLALSNNEVWGDVAKDLSLASRSGTAVVDMLRDYAQSHRDTRRSALEKKANRVSVASVGPLMVCFLPAFILVGVIPVIAGLVVNLLGS